VNPSEEKGDEKTTTSIERGELGNLQIVEFRHLTFSLPSLNLTIVPSNLCADTSLRGWDNLEEYPDFVSSDSYSSDSDDGMMADRRRRLPPQVINGEFIPRFRLCIIPDDEPLHSERSRCR
jgi:hypothetical protein